MDKDFLKAVESKAMFQFQCEEAIAKIAVMEEIIFNNLQLTAEDKVNLLEKLESLKIPILKNIAEDIYKR